eukprot:10127749-Prorocentrum_lima.AAC.1
MVAKVQEVAKCVGSVQAERALDKAYAAWVDVAETYLAGATGGEVCPGMRGRRAQEGWTPIVFRSRCRDV